MSRYKQFLVGIMAFASVIAGAAPSSVVSAADAGAPSENILLSPTKKRYDLKDGEAKRDTMKVVNDGTTAINFIVYARPYSVVNENYDPNYDDASKNADLYKWVQFDEGSYTLDPGKSVDIGYIVRVPKGATPGGHYGVLFAETQVTTQPTGTAIVQKKRVGAIVYATVDGEYKESGKFVDSSVPLFQFEAPLQARHRILNNGNTDFVVQGSVEVKDVFGGVKYKYQKESAVLPATTRLIQNDWANPTWIGVYKVDQTSKFLDTSKTTSNYVILIPIWVYIVAAVLIGARILYAVAHKKRKA